MSEPFSALANVTIGRPALLAYLAALPASPSTWNDWRRLGDDWASFSWDNDLLATLWAVQQRLGASNRAGVEGVMAYAEVTALGFCRYEEPKEQGPGGRFTFGTLTLSENLNDIMYFLSVARNIAAYLDDDDSGFAIVNNFIWAENDTLAIVGLGPRGHSNFLDPKRDEAAFAHHLTEAKALFGTIYDRYEQSGEDFETLKPVNDLDTLR